MELGGYNAATGEAIFTTKTGVKLLEMNIGENQVLRYHEIQNGFVRAEMQMRKQIIEEFRFSLERDVSTILNKYDL